MPRFRLYSMVFSVRGPSGRGGGGGGTAVQSAVECHGTQMAATWRRRHRAQDVATIRMDSTNCAWHVDVVVPCDCQICKSPSTCRHGQRAISMTHSPDTLLATALMPAPPSIHLSALPIRSLTVRRGTPAVEPLVRAPGKRVFLPQYRVSCLSAPLSAAPKAAMMIPTPTPRYRAKQPPSCLRMARAQSRPPAYCGCTRSAS